MTKSVVMATSWAYVNKNCFADAKQEPYGHLTSASAITDRFHMASVGKIFKGK